MKYARWFLAVLLMFLVGMMHAAKHLPLVPVAKTTPPETALKSYIERVRAQEAAELRTPGSLWSP